MNWKDALWEKCRKAYLQGGEVNIVFIKRERKRIPIIKWSFDNRIQCDEETITEED